ncbi:hypothetical protein RLOatenuis_2230 [Rickettsiales bacterium]|nr:hypothetical protein RLOatenuis_2230 [Rickettsiales bacterium]
MHTKDSTLQIIDADCHAICSTEIEDEYNKAYKGYRALWRAVIMQGMIDIENNSARTEDRVAKARAISWFLYPSKDFYTVCILADYDSKYVIEKAKELINKNKKKLGVKNNKLHGSKDMLQNSLAKKKSFTINF